jgi:2-dehydropantoate 2-reductase
MCVYNDTGKNTTSASETLLNKRIAIVGIGGVGGYLGAMLAHTYPHVTLAATERG